MGWLAWILLACLALTALLLLALHLFRFRYSFDYAFPSDAGGGMVLSFPGWRKEIPLGQEEDLPRSEVEATFGGPGPGQAGFLAVPERLALARDRLVARFKAAARKWALDPAVWGHLLAYILRSGLRLLRLVGPSMERLHVGSADVLNLGRFAAVWSSLTGAIPFLAGPVEYGFVERPFSLRLQVTGGCSGLQALAFLGALLFTLPWRRLLARFRLGWRHPDLEPWQARLIAAVR